MTFFASICLFASLVTPTNELDIARQALRDGYYQQARIHAVAAGVANAETQMIILESYAREKRWSDILKTLFDWGEPVGDAFSYYRALALLKTGDQSGAQAVFDFGLPRDPVYRRLSARMLADLALTEGNAAKAADYLEKISDPDPDDKMLLAETRSRLGSEKEARALWHAVVADTNATARIVATAAANLGEAAVLREVLTNDVPVELKVFASLSLGRILVRDKATFDEGARLIRKAISDSPDTDGAADALRVLASELLARRDWVGAADSFAQVLEIWPEMARDASVQEGYGQALMNLGRTEEALSVFLRAEACAKTDDEKVSAIIRSGDALAALGRLDDSMAKYRDVQTRFPKTTAAARLADIVRIRELEAKGRSLYRDFRFAEAQKCFAEVAAHDAARRGRMSYYEVLCLYGQGRDKDAERRAQELLESSDDLALRADVTRWLARAAFNRSRWTEADQLFSAYAALSVVPAADADEARVWSARAALAANDFDGAIARAAEVVKASSDGAVCARAQAVQGEALLELGRFDEAVYVFERAASVLALPPAERMEIQILRADALFALGADNSLRYEEALGVYRTLVQAENVSTEDALSLAYKIGITLEKLKRRDEALDQYYSGVVLAYRDLRQRRERLGDRAKAVFARAAFRLADICESRGSFEQAIRTLELVSSSDVPAADEAARRIERIRMKGILP